MPIFGRLDERRVVPDFADRFIDRLPVAVDRQTAFEQELDDLDLPTAYGELEQVELAERHGVQIGPGLDERVQGFDMPALGREHDRRLAVHVPRLDWCPAGEQLPDSRD